MRTFVLTVALLTVAVAGSFAQTTYGLKGGLNISSVRDPRDDAKSLVGFHAGGFVTAPISDRFALQPELLYSQQGYETKDYEFSYHYLNVPLIFKGTISGGLHAQVGPQFSVLIRANQNRDKITEDITEKRNQFDSALGLGLGYDLATLHFSARYNLGLSDTNDNGKGFNGFTNNVFQLSLGISL